MEAIAELAKGIRGCLGQRLAQLNGSGLGNSLDACISYDKRVAAERDDNAPILKNERLPLNAEHLTGSVDGTLAVLQDGKNNRNQVGEGIVGSDAAEDTNSVGAAPEVIVVDNSQLIAVAGVKRNGFHEAADGNAVSNGNHGALNVGVEHGIVNNANLIQHTEQEDGTGEPAGELGSVRGALQVEQPVENCSHHIRSVGPVVLRVGLKKRGQMLLDDGSQKGAALGALDAGRRKGLLEKVDELLLGSVADTSARLGKAATAQRGKITRGIVKEVLAASEAAELDVLAAQLQILWHEARVHLAGL